MSVVSATGSLLSSLLFKLKHSAGDAEGFLLGDVQKRCVENITDSQSSGMREEKRICIQSFTSFLSKFNFYDQLGRLKFSQVKPFLDSNEKHVVGWFTYRRNTSHRLSMRERVIHGNLMTMFPNVDPKDFLCALVTDRLVDKSSVQSTEYTFYQWTGSFPQSIPVEVSNLRGSISLPYLNHHTNHLLTDYSPLLARHKKGFLSDDNEVIQVQQTELLYQAIVSHMAPLQSELVKNSAAIMELSNEVEQLRQLAGVQGSRDLLTLNTKQKEKLKLDEDVPLILMDVEIPTPSIVSTKTASTTAINRLEAVLDDTTPPGSQDLI